MGRFRRKPIEVDAVQWCPGVQVDGVHEIHQTPVRRQDGELIENTVACVNGSTFIDPSDWVLCFDDGRKTAVSDAEFRAEYESVPAAPAFSEAADIEAATPISTPSPAVQAEVPSWLVLRSEPPTEPGQYWIVSESMSRVVWVGRGGKNDVLRIDCDEIGGGQLPVTEFDGRWSGPIPAPVEPSPLPESAAQIPGEVEREDCTLALAIVRNVMPDVTYVSPTILRELAAIIARHLSPEREATGKLRDRVAELEAENAGLKESRKLFDKYVAPMIEQCHQMLDALNIPRLKPESGNDLSDKVRWVIEQLSSPPELRAEVERLKAESFNAVCNELAGELPDGWSVTVELELDAGVVSLHNPDGEEVEYASNRECILDQAMDALECAKDCAAVSTPESSHE